MEARIPNSLNVDLIDALVEGLADRIILRVQERLADQGPRKVIEKQLYTVKEAAEYLGRSEKSIRNLVARRLVPVIKKGKRVHLLKRDMDAWIEKDRV